MSILKNRIEHIKTREQKVRESLGQLVTITKTVKTEGPNYDPFYKTGYTDTTETFQEYCIVDWFTEQEILELTFGRMPSGSCALTARYEAKSLFEEAVNNKYVVTVEGKEMYCSSVTPTDLRTSIRVFCVRKGEKV